MAIIMVMAFPPNSTSDLQLSVMVCFMRDSIYNMDYLTLEDIELLDTYQQIKQLIHKY